MATMLRADQDARSARLLTLARKIDEDAVLIEHTRQKMICAIRMAIEMLDLCREPRRTVASNDSRPVHL